jgi:hypothetical protein
MQRNLIQNVTSTTRQDVLAQRSCLACFGVSLPPNNPMAAPDDNKVFVCLNGNFQHRHHERASKNYIEVESQPLFIQPEDLEASNCEIREAEIAQRVSQKAVRSIFISLVFHVYLIVWLADMTPPLKHRKIAAQNSTKLQMTVEMRAHGKDAMILAFLAAAAGTMLSYPSAISTGQAKGVVYQ